MVLTQHSNFFNQSIRLLLDQGAKEASYHAGATLLTSKVDMEQNGVQLHLSNGCVTHDE